MSPADEFAAVVLAAVICVAVLIGCGVTAFVEASPRRKELVDRFGTWLFDER